VIPLTFFLGSVNPQVVWAGRSGYPGLDQINIQIPVGFWNAQASVIVPVGCSVSLLAADSNTGVGSNTVTLPIAAAGGACTQPSFVLDPSVAQALGGQAAVNFGMLSVSQDGNQTTAGGSFYSVPGSALAADAGRGSASAGSCIAVPPAAYQTTGLSAGGSITVTGPAGQQPLASGDYVNYGGMVAATTIPPAGGTFTFASASDQYATVGPFNTAVNYPAPLVWTNQNSIGVINRAQGVQLTWTGGDADGVVAIRGSSFAAPGAQIPSASFMCSVPASTGEFTVPASVLQTLPVGGGTLTVENQSSPQAISAAGLDIGYAFAGAVFTVNTAYN